MATTLNPPVKIGDNVWEYTWTGDGPFAVWNYQTQQWQKRVTELTSLQILSDNSNEPPAIEVFDSTEAKTPDGLIYPSRVIVQWRAYKFANFYRIEKDDGGGYEEITIIAENGKGYYQFTSGALPTDTEQNYRVVMVDQYGGEANIDVDVTIQAHPLVPELDYSYSSGTGDVTIDEA